MSQLNETTAAKAAAALIRAIHSGGARRALPKLSKAELGEVAETAEKEIALSKPKFTTAKSAMRALQYGSPRRVATTQVDDDTLAKMADDDPNKTIANIHQTPQLCTLPRLGSKENHAALRKRLEKYGE